LEPISYLLAQQQEQPCEVVVLSLAPIKDRDTGFRADAASR